MSKIREGGEKDTPLNTTNSNNSLNFRRNSDRDLKSASDHERTSLAPSEETAATTPEGAFCPAHSKASSRSPLCSPSLKEEEEKLLPASEDASVRNRRRGRVELEQFEIQEPKASPSHQHIELIYTSADDYFDRDNYLRQSNCSSGYQPSSFSPRLSDYREPSPLPNSVPEASGEESLSIAVDSDAGGEDGRRESTASGRRLTISPPAGGEGEARRVSATDHTLTASNRILRKTSFAQAYEESVAASLSMPDNIQSAEPDVENNQRSNMADWDSEPVCNNRVKIWSLLAGVVVVIGIFISVIVSSVHRVREGNVGIYFKHGALMDDISHPGMHMMAPFVTEMMEINVRPHTDTLRPVSSITRDGIQNKFNEVQVLSDVETTKLVALIRKYGMEFKEALVYDRIREELRIFCANHTIDEVYNTMFLDIVAVVKERVESSIDRLAPNSIQILNLVIPKPEIPPDIAANYKQVKVQWTEQLVATQQQRTESIKKETESLKAVADAERHKAVLQIELEKQILEKEGEKNISILQNEIVKAREESNADVASYKKLKAAEANKALHTEQFVQMEMAKHLANNTKFYFSGQDSVLGSLLSNLLGKG